MTINTDIEQLNRHNFRNCLDSLARPGDVFPITPFFDSSLLAMASVLLYSEVQFYQDTDANWNMIKALTNSEETTAGKADYLFLVSPLVDILMDAKSGEQQSPEFSATLICCYADLTMGTPVKLSGPGIDGIKKTILPATTAFLQQLAQKNKHFPLGVDMYFLSATHTICGLPRTTMVEIL